MNALGFTVLMRSEPKTFEIGQMALDRFALSSSKDDADYR